MKRRQEETSLETLGLAFRQFIVSTPTFLYFDFYLNTAYAAYYVYVYTAICLIFKLL